MRFATVTEGVATEIKPGQIVKDPATGLQYPYGSLAVLKPAERLALGVYAFEGAFMAGPGRRILSRSLVFEDGAVREVLELEQESEVPKAISMRQGRLALLAAGLLDAVEAGIAAIPDPTQRRAAEIEWEYANEIQRQSPLILALGPTLGLSDSQIDELFIAGAAIP